MRGLQVYDHFLQFQVASNFDFANAIPNETKTSNFVVLQVLCSK